MTGRVHPIKTSAKTQISQYILIYMYLTDHKMYTTGSANLTRQTRFFLERLIGI